MISVIGVLTLGVGVAALRMREAFGICAIICFTLFGSAAALTLPGVGGIQPAHVLLGFLVVRSALDTKDLMDLLRHVRLGTAGFYLLLTCVWGVVGTIFLPRYFAGQFLVNPIRAAGLVEGVGEMPLVPTAGNLTQIVYFLGDLVFFVVTARFIRGERDVEAAGDFYLAYCAANILFAFADYMTMKTGTPFLMSFMRNASYTIYDDTAATELQRVKGSFTEASAFAYATVGAFCFTGRLYLAGVRTRLCGALTFLSLVFIILSASSTGYVALAPCAAILFGGAALRTLAGRGTRQDAGVTIFAPLGALALLLLVLLNAQATRYVHDMLDAIIFNKGTSQSGIDRAALNAEGIQAFLKSHWLGAGVGSVRASSLVVAALANLGLIGSALYGMFILGLFGIRNPRQAPRTRRARDVRSAARCALLAWLAAATTSGALIDLGLAFFAVAAIACASTTADQGLTRPVRLRRTADGGRPLALSARPASAGRSTCP